MAGFTVKGSNLTFFFSVMSQETKERALTRMLFPRVVVDAISRQNWMSVVRCGTTMPTSHSTSSSNSSMASHALSWRPIYIDSGGTEEEMWEGIEEGVHRDSKGDREIVQWYIYIPHQSV